MLKSFFCVCTVFAGVALFAEDITANDGTVYKNASISSVTPVGFDVCYSPKKGSVIIKELFFKDLPEKYRQKYNFNAQRAADFQQKVNEYQAEHAKDLAKAYRQRLTAAKENDHAYAAIYAERMNIILSPLHSIPGGCIAYASLPDATPTTGNLGKFVVIGVELPQGADWAGTIYPTGKSADTDQGRLQVYCTSIDQALMMAKHEIYYNPASGE